MWWYNLKTKKLDLINFNKSDVIDKKIIKIINEENIEKKYNLILDYIYDFLDYEIQNKNYCDFQDGKCIANRLKKSVHQDNGCCYQYKIGICKYLHKETCTIKNVSCKLFMCEYIESQVIKFKLDSIIPVKSLFNKKQVKIIEKSYFKTRNEVINLLLKYK